MSQQHLKQALQSRQVTVGSWLMFPAEAPAEIMARAGFEWLVVDLEHGPLGIGDAQRLIRIIDLAGVSPLCRLPSNDPALATQLLDAGAWGLLVPKIESAAQARQAVAAAYYPPRGRRGVGLARAQAYGRGLEPYRHRLEDSMVVIAMIETEQGVEQVGAIAATPGIDGLFIGPYDLSASLGHIGQLDHPEVRAAGQRALEAARVAGIGCGIHLVHPSRRGVETAIEEGYTILALGVDMILLDEAARAAVSWAGATRRPLKEERDEIETPDATGERGVNP